MAAMADDDERYAKLIENLLARAVPFAATRESATVAQVERATALADLLADRPVSAVGVRADVVDAAGHRRPVYRSVLAYAYRAAGVAPPLADRWLASLPTADVAFTAADGAAAAAAVWAALAKGDAAVFQQLLDAQQPSGAFLKSTSSDNPETHWYHELVILHAAADFAIWTDDDAMEAAVVRATLFHLNETETDHATGQPWGLPAFVRVAGAEPLVGAALHAVEAHQPAGPSGLALFLLADTLYGLRHAPGTFVPAAKE